MTLFNKLLINLVMVVLMIILLPLVMLGLVFTVLKITAYRQGWVSKPLHIRERPRFEKVINPR
ncbi:hypothetical protein [Oceanicoccus sagamiensis]|uniref:Uncharacterized protein n=1 Tax=Oceanicoccus sagamiensis TaxID=716816 RepID=A0A1X9NDC6_9GAMM|nr:hypothetical protein [Oceanicoccus sagamiensis]ARN75161.1 hypothetical protein BST96_14180 [Oceanicoccus sagamiensis]